MLGALIYDYGARLNMRAHVGHFLHIVLPVCKYITWWIDTCGSLHVCAHISLFSSYEFMDSSILMCNEMLGFILVVGMIKLKFTLGRSLLVQIDTVNISQNHF